MTDIYQKVRDENLYTKCRKFIKDVFDIEEIKGKEIGLDGFGHYTLFLHGLENVVTKYPSFIECKEHMENDEVVSKHLNSSVGVWYRSQGYTVWNYLSYFVREQLYGNSGVFKIDEEIFGLNYCNFEDFFYEDTIKMRYVLNLLNFDMHGKELRLSDDIIIREMNRMDYRLYPIRKTAKSEYIIEYTFEEKKLLGAGLKDLGKEVINKKYQQDEDMITKLFMVFSALTLIKEGRVISGTYYKTAMSDVINVSVSRPELYNPNILHLRPYILEYDEIKKFKELYRKIEKLNIAKHKQFEFALRRLGLATNRFRYDDRLIDLAISFEALLYHKDGKGELTHKLATRTAKLLENNLKDRKELFTFMKRMYRIRSRIVHGGSYKLKINDIDDFANYLRQVMCTYLSILMTMNHAELIDWLDLS